jgi:cytochrome c peroxidase
MPRHLLFAGPVLALVATALGAGVPSPPAKDTLPDKLSLTELPLGLPARPVPKDNALSEARVRLGRRLFFDPILSADQSVACATCHRPDHGFASGEARPRGIGGRRTARRAPALLNRAYGSSFFWDGRVATLEEQALQPIANPVEMGTSVELVVKRLRANRDYQAQFAAAFPDGVTAANLGRSLASFERVLLRGDSRVDRFRRLGEHAALSAEERRGLWLYESKGRCWRCHTGATFTDEGFHNTGVGWGDEPADPGRFAVTKREGDKGKFKTPTLRGVILAAPYMHDGSLETLEEVVEFYNKGGRPNPNLDAFLEPLELSKDEVRDLVAFLKAL